MNTPLLTHEAMYGRIEPLIVAGLMGRFTRELNNVIYYHLYINGFINEFTTRQYLLTMVVFRRIQELFINFYQNYAHGGNRIRRMRTRYNSIIDHLQIFQDRLHRFPGQNQIVHQPNQHFRRVIDLDDYDDGSLIDSTDDEYVVMEVDDE
jgi:hypothetical protein